MNLLDVGGHELAKLLVAAYLEMADEFINDHFVFDGLSSSDGEGVQDELEGVLD